NPILARGVEPFVAALAGAGVAGLIVPDLPIEEAPAVLADCDGAGVDLVPLLAPTTPPERARAIGSRARRVLYVVSTRGTTGERGSTADGVAPLLARAKAATAVPVAIGFGISTPEQGAQAARAGADGIIVGTRLVRAAAESCDPPTAVGELVGRFAAALPGGRSVVS
ncbi:MAG: tryptophan synthase subunit alpha, partial [Solirubrobacteraceae bacterium]